MRIQPVQADVNVSGDYPGRGIPATAFQSGLGVAAREIQGTADDIARLYAHKARADAESEGLLLQSQAELALQKHDDALKQTETDGAKYLQQRQQAFQDVVKQVSSTASSPAARRVFENHMARAIIPLNGKALTYSSDLIDKKDRADLTTTLDNYSTLGGMTDYTDTERIAQISANQTAAIMMRAPALGGVDKATELAITERKKLTEEIAYRHKESDPVNFLETAGLRYRGMDAEKLDKLIVSAGEKVEAQQKTARQEAEKFHQEQLRIAEEDRQQTLIVADQKAANGTLTASDLQRMIEMRTFKNPSELDHMRKLMESPPDKPSDPATLLRVGGEIHGLVAPLPAAAINAKISEVRRLMGEGLIARKDGFPLIDRLREHGQRGEDKEYQQRGVAYQTSVDEGYKWLGISGPLESLDPQTKKLQAQFLSDMNARSDWTNTRNGGNSREILYQILPKFLSAQKTDTRLNYEAQAELLPKDITGPLPIGGAGKPLEGYGEVWDAWYNETAKRVDALKFKNPSLYERTRQQMQELKNARQRILDNETRTQEFKSSGGAGGGQTGRLPVKSGG